MRINAIGMGMGKEQAPYGQGERWGLTRTIHKFPVDVLFDMHDPDQLDEQGKKLFVERLETALANDVVVYNCLTYPIHQIMNHFQTDYFADSVAYALALAIYQGATEIHTYGVNQSKSNNTEYHLHKACTDYWVGYARGKGIKVEIHGPSEVCKTHNRKLYGYNVCGKSIRTN